MNIVAVKKKIGQYLNLHELVFDITLAAAALIIYRVIVPKNGFLLLKNDVFLIMAVIVGVQFFTAFFFAGILRKFDELKEKYRSENSSHGEKPAGVIERLNRWLITKPAATVIFYILVFIGITGLFMLTPMKFYNIIDKISIDAAENDPNRFLGMFASFLAGVSVILPGMILFNDEKQYIRWYILITFPLIYEFLAFPFSIVYFANLAGAAGAIAFVLITAAVIAGIILLKRYFAGRDTKPVPVIGRISGIFRVIIIPFLTAIALIAWNEMSLISSVSELLKENTPVNMLNLFPLLLFSGLIPVRAVVLFSPPVKPLNFVISAASMFYFFFSLEALLPGLTDALIKMK